MNIKIPEFCLITLIGSSMSGKTTFANTHFDYKQVLSSDNFREMICGDSMNQSINSDAFESLYFISNSLPLSSSNLRKQNLTLFLFKFKIIEGKKYILIR